MVDKNYYVNYNIINSKMNEKYSYNNVISNKSHGNNLNFGNVFNENIKMIPKLWTTIIPNLYVSNLDTAINNNFINNKNISLIINLCENFDNTNIHKTTIYNKNIKFLNINYLSIDNTTKLINLIYDYIYKNSKVLIFCETGFNKSDILVACFLCKYTKLKKENVINCLKSKNNLFFSNINKDNELIKFFESN